MQRGVSADTLNAILGAWLIVQDETKKNQDKTCRKLSGVGRGSGVCPSFCLIVHHRYWCGQGGLPSHLIMHRGSYPREAHPHTWHFMSVLFKWGSPSSHLGMHKESLLTFMLLFYMTLQIQPGTLKLGNRRKEERLAKKWAYPSKTWWLVTNISWRRRETQGQLSESVRLQVQQAVFHFRLN